MRSACALLLLLLPALGCGSDEPAPAPDGPAPDAPVDPASVEAQPRTVPAPEAPAGETATWPSAELLAQAARLGDPASRDEAIASLEKLPLAARVDLLRAGLRLPDGPAALECARHMEREWLDDAEMSRVTLLLAAAIASGDTTYESNDYGDLLEFVSGGDLTEILASFPPEDPSVLPGASVAILHKITRAHHLPRLAALYAQDPQLGEALDELVWLVVRNTDQHREDVARIALGADVAAALPADDGAGLPPLLVACLQYALDTQQLGDEYGFWTMRWLRDETPGGRDVPLLLRLGLTGAAGEAVWSLRSVPGPAAQDALLRLAKAGDDDEFRVRGALAHRGDAKSLAQVVAATPQDEHALAVLLGLDPKLAVDRVAAVLLDPTTSDKEFEDLLAVVETAATDVRDLDGLDWDSAAFDGFPTRLIEKPLPPERIADIAYSVPRCWTRGMADLCLQRLSDRPPTRWVEGGDLSGLEILEVAAPDALRARLRKWAALPPGAESSYALGALALLGDPQSGELLAAWAERDLDGPWEFAQLARSPSPAVRGFLERFVRGEVAGSTEETIDGAAWAIAAMDGVPAEAWDLTEDVEDLRPELHRLILEGKAVDALLLLFDDAPGVERWGAGDVDDERVIARLRSIRDRRELGLYAWATGELAIAGDADARAEILRATAGTRYRWGDILDWRALTLGWDPETIPLWLDGLESSCCWRPIAVHALHNFLGEEPSTDNGYGITAREQMERWLAEHPGPYVRSHLAGYFLPAVR